LVGNYDVEILSTPSYQVSSSIISKQNKEIVVPQYGKLEVSNESGLVSDIISTSNNKLIKTFSRLSTERSSEYLYLLPGSYNIIYRNNTSNKTEDNKSKSVTIKSGEITRIQLK
jgi:hypothetical protein